MITIFSAPKPFSDPKISLIQCNAIRSWINLEDEVEVILLGDEQGIKETADSLGTGWIGPLDRAPSGAPIVRSVFEEARRVAKHPVLCYVNADIIFLSGFLESIRITANRFESFLIVGQRWDLGLDEALDFPSGWEDTLQTQLVREGRRHPPMGSDYFIFPSDHFQMMPEFALGRAGWDNWMIFRARNLHIPVVDASEVITAIHQDHDYAHLPGGRPHYELPESRANVELAGGVETIFTLRDATWTMDASGVRRKRLRELSFLRWAEANLLVITSPGKIAKAIRLLFHPHEFWKYIVHQTLQFRAQLRK